MKLAQTIDDVVGIAVVGTERDLRGAELLHERRERDEAARHRRLSHEEPDSRAQPVAAFLERQGLVVGADARRCVRIQLAAGERGCVTVDMAGAAQPELRQLARVAGDDAGEVHHLAEPEHPVARHQRLEVGVGERAARRLEGRGRHARRRHEVDVQRQLGAEVHQPVHAVGAEHVRQLVGIADHRGHAVRDDRAGELARRELGGLDVHVRVDEAGDDELAGGVDRLPSLVLADAGDPPVRERDVGIEPLAREHREDAAALQHEVGRLVSPGDGDSAGEINHRDQPIRL